MSEHIEGSRQRVVTYRVLLFRWEYMEPMRRAARETGAGGELPPSRDFVTPHRLGPKQPATCRSKIHEKEKEISQLPAGSGKVMGLSEFAQLVDFSGKIIILTLFLAEG